MYTALYLYVFPFRVVFVICFILKLKLKHFPAFESSPSSLQSIPDRTDQQGGWCASGGGRRSCSAPSGGSRSCSVPSGCRRSCNTPWDSWAGTQAGGSTHEVGTGSWHSKTGSSQGGGARSRARSFREPTESASEPAPFREPTESAPEPAPFRESMHSTPEPAPSCEPTQSTPVLEPTEPAQWPPALASCPAGPVLTSCSACPALTPLSAYSSMPSSTPQAWPTVPTPDPPPAHPPPRHFSVFSVCGASGIHSLKGGLCHGPAGVPGLATRCLCVLSTWLVVCCWCHVLSCRISAPSRLVN